MSKGDAVDLFGSEGLLPNTNNEAFAAEDGSALLLKSTASIGSTTPTSIASYVFSRNAEGWRTRVLARSLARPQVSVVEAFDPAALSHVGFGDLTGSFSELFGGDPAAVQESNQVGPVGGPYAQLSVMSGFAIFGPKVYLMGGSEDLSHVILESENHELAPGTSGLDEGSTALYESVGGEGCDSASSSCKLVGIDPEGAPFQCGAALGQGGGQVIRGGTEGAVSSDGSRVIFTAPDPGLSELPPEGPGCWLPKTVPQENPPQVYMRENGASTVEVSAPEAGVTVGSPANPSLPTVFVGASADGSKLFFLTRTELTADDTTHAPELYEYETTTGNLTRVSHGESGTAEGNVDFVATVSRDGSEVYFTAFGKLAPRAAALTPGGPLSDVNLYRYDTLTGKIYFITTLNQADYPLNIGGENTGIWFREFGQAQGLGSDKEWYTTGDGRDLVFGTIRSITGFDNTPAPGVQCISNYQAVVHSPCLELYRYDVAAEERGENPIVCVSCGGGTPVDGSYFARSVYRTPASSPPRPISEDGGYVFFDSANALVPQATPDRVHVYEWHAGTISLISAPSDPGNAFFLGSSTDGHNVFFTTHAQLARQDTDQSNDVYDARIGGGFAGLTAPQCTGTGCQGVPAAPSTFATPASATFEGAGNVAAVPASVKPKPGHCKKGYAKKRHRCVKRVRARSKKAKRSSAKGGK